jgi:hypothetical protein
MSQTTPPTKSSRPIVLNLIALLLLSLLLLVAFFFYYLLQPGRLLADPPVADQTVSPSPEVLGLVEGVQTQLNAITELNTSTTNDLGELRQHVETAEAHIIQLGSRVRLLEEETLAIKRGMLDIKLSTAGVSAMSAQLQTYDSYLSTLEFNVGRLSNSVQQNAAFIATILDAIPKPAAEPEVLRPEVEQNFTIPDTF